VKGDRVDVQADIRSAQTWAAPVTRFLRRCLNEARLQHTVGMPAGPVQLSVLLTGDAHMRRLNHRWRGLDRPTDVLSFAAAEGTELPVHEGARHLGDLAVSVMTARRQARTAGRNLEEELRTLLVHGLLHLLGHDHQDDEQELRMERHAASLGYSSRPELLA
jgi:probable rRNA maturation factor